MSLTSSHTCVDVNGPVLLVDYCMKTNCACGQMTAQTTLRRERVIYIDTDGSFSGKRFAAMHERLTEGAPEADLLAALRCVDLFRVHDLHGMLQLLSALHTKLEVRTALAYCHA